MNPPDHYQLRPEIEFPQQSQYDCGSCAASSKPPPYLRQENTD
jgi:hypothetical protein